MDDETRGLEVAAYLRGIAQDFQRLEQEVARSVQPTPFDALTRLAVERVPSARAASITILRGDRFETTAATDEIARQADKIQYALGSGPCIDAVVDDTIYRPKDLAADRRWPHYGRRVVAELGLRSMLSYRMHLEATELTAGLNLYGDEPDAFDERDLAEGLLLVTHAAQVVTAAHLRNKNRNLEQALHSNRDIGTAIGVLMGQHKITRDEAFALLRIASQNTNRKLSEVALDVIDTGTVDVSPSHGMD